MASFTHQGSTRGRLPAALGSMVLLAALAGCATPQTRAPVASAPQVKTESAEQMRFALRQEQEAYVRVEGIMGRLTMANPDLCGRRIVRTSGMRVHAAFTYGERAKAARAVFGMTDGWHVDMVIPGSPAALSGLKAGDRLVAMDGLPIPAVATDAAGINAPFTQAFQDNRAVVEVERLGPQGPERLSFDVATRPTCDYLAVILNSPEVNAFANDELVAVTTGMLRFVQSDDELAVVLGHEMAHNVMTHTAKTRKNAQTGNAAGAVLGVLLGAATGVYTNAFALEGERQGALRYSKEFETEADYVGLYLTRRAGFTTTGAERLWRRMAAEAGGVQVSNDTHPTSAERFVLLAQTNAEMDRKAEAGQPLLPEMDALPNPPPRGTGPQPGSGQGQGEVSHTYDLNED